jgi:ketosteroid isomerase-like protein
MRSVFIPAILVTAALALGGCASQEPSQEFGKQDVDQVRQMLQGFVAAYNAKDVEKVGSFFAPTAAIMPPNSSTLHGVDSVKGYFESRFRDDGASDLVVEIMAMEGHGPIGFIAGTFSLNLKGPDGSKTQHDRGKVIWIIHKYAGQWKFEWQIMSSDLPAGPPVQ